MTLLISFIALVLVGIGIITLSNVLVFPRLRATHTLGGVLPFVSVMVPARNEADVIENTVRCLLNQDYPKYEVILLDDDSSDNTREIVRQVADNDCRLTVMCGRPLPDGWVGKNWACHQMAQVAKGDILVFTDADVVWKPSALLSLVAEVVRTEADLYTIWPTQITVTWAERLCVPLMALVVLGYLPIVGTHYLPFGAFGASNGQCMAWRKRAYFQLGGHQGVRNAVLEDVTLARKVKVHRLRLRMADGNALLTCRMYTDWLSVRNGYAKNILAGYGSSIIALLLATIFHWLIFIFPWLWLIFGWAFWEGPHYPGLPLALIIIGLVVRALTASFTQQRVIDSIYMPVSVMLMTRIALQSIWWKYRYGGPRWKGRTIPMEQTST